jgi:hypothetical protein
MGIADFFRPKYRHSDVKVRLEAVRALTSEDSDILANIARTDREATVRRVAIEKLDEADVLAAIAKEESDRALRDLAGTRAAALWVSRACQDGDDAEAALDGLLDLGDQRALADVAARAARPAVRSAALARIDDPRALAELAKHTQHPALRTHALERITDPDVLAAIALDTTNKELGIAAVDRFEEEDLLEKVAQKAKHKGVRQRARRKLDELADDRRAAAPQVSDAVRRRRAEQAQLLRELETFHDVHEWEKSMAAVSRIEAEWARLAGADEPAVEERFQKAVARYHSRRNAAIELAEAHRHELEEKRRASGEHTVAPAPAVKSEPARPEPAKPEPARPDRTETPTADLTAQRKEADERAKAIAASLDALLGEMQTMLESKDGRAIDRLLGQAAKAFEQVTRVFGDQRRALEERYREARSGLVIRVQELREAEDWQRWANVPRAEALIKEALAMLEAEEPPELPRLKDLQARWKSVGAIPRNKSQELWEKFKATCDQVFEKIRAGRAVAAEKAAAAAAVKEQLIAQAEALAESTDWDATAEAFKELQRRWKESGNVPRKQGDALWKRFRAACDRFFERRKPHLEAHLEEQQRNLEEKTALCVRAEAVVAAAPPEAGWGAAIAEIRDLQRRWKDIGHVPRKDADAIYRRFRAACDGLFAKRDAARDAEADVRRAELDAVRAGLAEIPGAADAPARVIALRTTLKELAGRDVRPDPELVAEIDKVVQAVVAENPAGFAGTELDVEAMRARRDKLVGKAEELLPKQSPTVEANLPPEQIVARLKDAIASRALGDFRGAGRDPFEAVDELRTAWAEIGPVVGEAAEQLAVRFAEVCEQVIAAAKAEGRRDEREPPREERPRRERRERRERRPNAEESAPAAAAAPAAEAAPAPAAAPAAAPAPAAAVEPAPPPAAEPAGADPAQADVDAGWD